MNTYDAVTRLGYLINQMSLVQFSAMERVAL